MPPITTGQPAPDFTLPAARDGEFTLSARRGQPIVVYFYPRANTPGCTTEAQAFRDLADQFRAADCVIVGISRDSLRVQQRFRERHDLPFDLLADPDEVVCSEYAVMREKTLYGKRVRGIERSTFLIDAHGILREQWRGVKVPGHVDTVVAAVQAL